MQTILTYLIIGAFVAILAFAVYFRIRVLHYYRRLRESPVSFEPKHIIDKEYLEKNILPKYPDYAEDIMGFSNHLRFSLMCASALIIVITAFAALKMFVFKV